MFSSVGKKITKFMEFLDAHSGTVTGVATAVIAALTYYIAGDAHDQDRVLSDQLKAMQNQLDVMQTDKRPWIESKISIAYPIIFTEWDGHRSMNLRLKFDLKNHGQTPAINVKTWTVIEPHPSNDNRSEMDKLQRADCDSLKKESEENPISGIAIFPNNSATIVSGGGTAGVYDKTDNVFFIVYGCVGYSYGNARYGETGYRMILGKFGKPYVLGIPFVYGAPRLYYHPSVELLAQGYPAKAPIDGFMRSSKGIIFRNDEGGNYVR